MQQNNLVVGAVVAAIGLVALLAGWFIRSTALQMASWPTVQGKVLSSTVTSKRERRTSGTSDDRRSRNQTMYTAKVRYEYSVEGKRYESSRIGAMEQSSSSRSSAQSRADRYPVGGACTVHYDPSDPASAVLEVGGGTIGLIVMIVGALALAGGGAVAGGLAGDVASQAGIPTDAGEEYDDA